MTLRTLLMASAFSLPIAAQAQAQTAIAPGVPTTGGIIIQNPTAAAIPARGIVFGTAFAQGTVQPSSGITASIGGSAVVAQLNAHSTWPDGSVRNASVALAAPALAAGAIVAVALAPGGANGATLAWCNPAVVVAGVPGAGTLTLTANLASSTDTWLAGPEVVERRFDTGPVGDGSYHVVADARCFADGSQQADISVRRDNTTVIAQGSSTSQTSTAPDSYTATLSLNGSSVTEAVANHNAYQDWHAELGVVGRNVQHDIPSLIAAGVLPPFDMAQPVNTSATSSYSANVSNLTASGFGAPLNPNGVTVGQNGTGARPDIGITTGANAEWVKTQTDVARRAALGQADAGGSMPLHFWNAGSNRWVDTVDFPTLNAASSSDAYNTMFAAAVPGQSSTQTWDISYGHMPDLDYIPAVLTGNRFFYDMQQGLALGEMAIDYPPNRGATQDSMFGAAGNCAPAPDCGPQVREMAWFYRNWVNAWALSTPGGAENTRLAQGLADSWSYFNSVSPTWTSLQGSIATFFPGREATGHVSPWQQDYFVAATGQGALLGDPHAAAGMAKIASARIAAFLPHAGWDNSDAVTNEWQYLTLSGGAAVTDYATLEQQQQAAGFHTTNAFRDTQGDYFSLGRQSMAYYLRLFPGDANAPTALSGLLGGPPQPYRTASNSLSDAVFQDSLVQEDMLIPTSAAANTAWTSAESQYGSASSTGTTSSSTGTGTSSTGTSSTGTTTTGSATGSGSGTVSATSVGLVLPNIGEPMSFAIGGLHIPTLNGLAAGAAAGDIVVTSATLPGGCRPGDHYLVKGARLGTQAAAAGLDAPAYCNAAGQVVLTATGLAPTF